MRPLNKGFRTAILGTLIATVLGGCAAAVVGGGIAASSIADRRSAGSMADDEVMELHIKSKAQSVLSKSYQGYKPSVSVVSYNRRILLLGQVPSQADRQLVERIARAERSAAAVYNYINVVPQQRSIANISNDTLITSRVRANLLNVPGVYPGHVKVVTYDGVSYMMGLLTPAQQAAVSQRVSMTPGVLRVVTLYENFTPANAY